MTIRAVSSLNIGLVSFCVFILASKYSHQGANRKLPLVSGLLIPFAILMEIPGLTEHVIVLNHSLAGAF